MTTYAEKLKDPRWQKKRLEILERDGWACRVCGDKASTLHVHHKKYCRDPWDAKSEDLTTLCEAHHDSAESYVRTVRERSDDPGFMLALECLILHHDSAGDDVWKIFKPIFPSLNDTE